MKKILLVLSLIWFNLTAQEAPSILRNLNVRFDKEYEAFIIYDNDVDTLIKRTVDFKLVCKEEDEDSILIIKRNDNIEVTISIVFGLKSASVSFVS